MIERIDHINIVTKNLDKAVTFFALLGFAEGVNSELDSQFLAKVTGIDGAAGKFMVMRDRGSGVTIELLEFNSHQASDPDLGLANRPGIRHLAFAVRNIEETVQKLAQQGIQFLSPVQTWQKTGKKLVYFYGPDGILLELAQYPEKS